MKPAGNPPGGAARCALLSGACPDKPQDTMAKKSDFPWVGLAMAVGPAILAGITPWAFIDILAGIWYVFLFLAFAKEKGGWITVAIIIGLALAYLYIGQLAG